MNKPTFYITTPIYYVNDKPHIGHAYTTVAADVIARYKRMCGYDVMFLTGTDEHGQKMEQAASKQGVKPIELANANMARFKDLWKTLNISNNDFIRTTEERHKKTLWVMFEKMLAAGDIYMGEYEGWYCTPDEAYWTETQLLDGNRCPDCGRPTVKLKEPSYFFKMSKYQDRILEHIAKNPNFIMPESRRNEIVSFVKDGLRDLSISRVNFSWGVPVESDPKHVIYVWVDALVNYLSAIGYFEDNDLRKKYWPADFHLVGKDILRFHTVYWPSMLMSAGIELPKSIFAHGWWTVEGAKMSKSMGNAIDPNHIVENFSVDPFRYFLMREVPFGLDGDFSIRALIHRINGDLANDIGNLLSRTQGMLQRYFAGVTQPYNAPTDADNQIYDAVANLAQNVDDKLKTLSFNKALASIWEVVGILNRYIDENRPWFLAKDETQKDRLGSVLYTVLDSLRAISYFIYPFMPDSALEIRRQLALTEDVNVNSIDDLKRIKLFKSGVTLPESKAVFPRIDDKAVLEKMGAASVEPAKNNKQDEVNVCKIDFADFEKVAIKSAKVKACENVPKSDKLLKLTVDAGDGDRVILSGIAKSYKPEELVGLTIAIIENLKPVKLMGVESNGMVLSAFDGSRHNVLKLSDETPAGTRIK